MGRTPTIAFLFFIVASCQSKPKTKDTIYIPFDSKNVVVVNTVDENGKKQGLWHETDTIHHRITKEYYYKDDLLDGSYLVYKFDSPDTLILGMYKQGHKHGEWKYWDSTLNRIYRIESYIHDTLKDTKKY